jgi:hypothetical protein
MSWEIDKGWGQGDWKQILSRFTIELPQTMLGYLYSGARTYAGKVDKVKRFDGATFAITEYSKKNDGLSLGSFININDKGKVEGNTTNEFKNYLLSNPLYMHEYGHYLQSQYYGPSYLFYIGIPSIFSAAFSKQIEGEPTGITTHKGFYTEMEANILSKGYFGSNYGVNWNSPYHIWGKDYLYLGTTIETFYPTIKRW